MNWDDDGHRSVSSLPDDVRVKLQAEELRAGRGFWLTIALCIVAGIVLALWAIGKVHGG